jgi:uncharacterized membrane protein YfcA
MLQRLIGIGLGALATYLLLIILAPPVGNDQQNYVTAVIVGAIIGFFWPVAIGWYLARRARARRDERMNEEVNRQVQEELSKQQQPR